MGSATDHLAKRDLEWYKKLKKGDIYYDVSNRTIRKETYIGYCKNDDITWIVSGHGMSRLHTRMYPHYEYDLMLERVHQVELMKAKAQIEVTEKKLDKLKEKFTEMEDLEEFKRFEIEHIDFTSEQPFASLDEYAMDMVRNLVQNGNNVETNIDIS